MSAQTSNNHLPLLSGHYNNCLPWRCFNVAGNHIRHTRVSIHSEPIIISYGIHNCQWSANDKHHYLYQPVMKKIQIVSILSSAHVAECVSGTISFQSSSNVTKGSGNGQYFLPLTAKALDSKHWAIYNGDQYYLCLFHERPVVLIMLVGYWNIFIMRLIRQ